MSDRDPTRWSELGGGAPAELRELLDTARNDVPDDAEMKAMGLTVGAITAACVGGTIAGASSGGAMAGAKATAGAAGAAGAGAGVSGAAGVSSAVLGSTAVKIGAGLLLVGGATFGTWSAMREAPPEPTDSPAVVVIEADERGAEPEVTVDEAPEEVGSADVEAETTEPSLDDVVAEEALPGTPSPRKAVSTPSEVSLLKAAQRALRRDPERAIALVQQHQRLYPAGQLVQEREVIRIKALEALGREREARAADKKFEQNFPDSAHRSKLADEPRKQNPPSERDDPSP